jgi:hypothetical protein
MQDAGEMLRPFSDSYAPPQETADGTIFLLEISIRIEVNHLSHKRINLWRHAKLQDPILSAQAAGSKSAISATTVINLRHACMGGWSHRVNDFSMRCMSLWINKYAWTVGPSIVWVIP